MRIDSNTIDAHPDLVESSAVLASGQRVYFRPLRADQAAALGAYFTGLSQATRRVYGPHPFDQETADGFCAALDSAHTLRMLAWIEEEGVERIVGYFVVELGVRDGDRRRYEALGLDLHDETDCTLAPSVADAYQSQGLGSLMMQHLLGLLPRLGRQRMLLWAACARTIPAPFTFTPNSVFGAWGDFEAGGTNNYDMIAEL